MKNFILPLIALGLLGACAQNANNINSTYVPTHIYDDRSCKQLGNELHFVQSKARQLTGQINEKAKGDQTAAVVGAILFWPALFFIDGDDPVKRSQLADLKGKAETINRVLIDKDCDVKYKY